MSTIRLMSAKLHRVRVTDANVNYVGSITIDRDLIAKAGILPLQEVEVWNVSNGKRLSTYVLPAEARSGVVCLNGAAAHAFEPGDIAIIVAYEERDRTEVLTTGHQAKVILADGENRPQKIFAQSFLPEDLYTLTSKEF
jgi:aspartate 1-decarboxylase